MNEQELLACWEMLHKGVGREKEDDGSLLRCPRKRERSPRWKAGCLISLSIYYKRQAQGYWASQNATGDFSNIPMRLELQTLHEGDGAESSDLLPSVPAATFSLTLDFK